MRHDAGRMAETEKKMTETKGNIPTTGLRAEAPRSHALTWTFFLAFSIDVAASIPGDFVVLIKIAILCAIILLFSYSTMMEGRKVRPTGIFVAIYIYIFLLSIRLFHDFVIRGQTFFLYQNPVTLFAIFFGTVLLPGLMAGFQNGRLDIGRIVLGTQLLFFVVLFFSVRDILTGKLEIMSDGRYAGHGVLDMIYMGHQGVTLILISCYKFRKRLWLNIPCIILGIATLGCSGSRGPMLALLVCLVLMLLHSARSARSKIVIGIIFVVLAAIFPFVIETIGNVFDNLGIHSFARIIKFLNGESGYGSRNSLVESGMEQFLDHPYWGSSLLLSKTQEYTQNIYVHNIFLEQFMALGLPGGLFFLGIMIYTLAIGFRNWRRSDERSAGIFFVLFVQYLIFGCFSRTIVALPQLWVCTFIVLHYNDFRYVRRL